MFLDANVLFSAAYRSGSGLLKLWKLRGPVLITSQYAVQEARRNLTDTEARSRFDSLLSPLDIVAEVADRPLPADIDLPAKDRPIVLAALQARSTHLLTGDVRHFGRYFDTELMGMLVLPPRRYLTRPGG